MPLGTLVDQSRLPLKTSPQDARSLGFVLPGRFVHSGRRGSQAKFFDGGFDACLCDSSVAGSANSSIPSQFGLLGLKARQRPQLRFVIRLPMCASRAQIGEYTSSAAGAS